MIGIDWGTTNLRAYRFDAGVVTATAAGPGIMAVPPGGFPAALTEAIGPWLGEGERRVLLSGMVGSRQGWAEAPYLPCPADPAALAAAAIPVPFAAAAIRILPGLSCLAGVPEVMRGEEVQIAGALPQTGPDATLCLPGTHSKWARIRAGRVEGFHTAMTGEVFAAVRGHTILGRLMTDAPHDAAAFLQGVDRAREPGGLLHHLFGVRTLGLFGDLAETQAASYLSGLLIGHEVAAARPEGPVCLVGAPALTPLYAAALDRCGIAVRVIAEDAAAAGLAHLGEHVAWD